jgi:hypothetical protein
VRDGVSYGDSTHMCASMGLAKSIRLKTPEQAKDDRRIVNDLLYGNCYRGACLTQDTQDDRYGGAG